MAKGCSREATTSEDRMQSINYITINMGHSLLTARSDVRDETLWKLQPLIDADGGPVPWLGFYLDITRPVDPMTYRPIGETASWSILRGLKQPAPLITKSVACWSDACSQDAWGSAMMYHRTLGVPLHPKLKKPAEVPWLATALYSGLKGLPKETIARLTNFNRCVAWAIIETPE
jgi:hypothetical protein